MALKEFPGFTLQAKPSTILFANIEGQFLLRTTTPSWRIDDPQLGFQRTVNENRAQKIAANVIDQGRIFPNTIVLATNTNEIEATNGLIRIDENIKFLIVDGQHRLWAQRFSKRDISYGCTIHLGLSEPEMAELFVEINDTQKRVPASLRWDLVRLTRSDKDPELARAADLTFDLSTDIASPLFQRIDLTGEDKSKSLTQASIAPEIKALVKKKTSPMKMGDVGYETQKKCLIDFFSAIKSLDRSGWNSGNSNLYQNRVLRALLQLYPAISRTISDDINGVSSKNLSAFLTSIDVSALDSDRIRGQQGSAGITQIRNVISAMLWGETEQS